MNFNENESKHFLTKSFRIHPDGVEQFHYIEVPLQKCAWNQNMFACSHQTSYP